MTTLDIRNATWDEVRMTLNGRLKSVYEAWRSWGAGTTRGLAKWSGIDILNVRPRTTDLTKLGLICLEGVDGGEGIYRARTENEWRAWVEEQCLADSAQLDLTI